MKFQKYVTREEREFLTRILKEYEQERVMTEEECKDLYNWVACGRSPYDNGDYLCDDNGYPLDFISAMRANQELQEWFDSLTDEEKEAERMDAYLDQDRFDKSHPDTTMFKISSMEDEELPFW